MFSRTCVSALTFVLASFAAFSPAKAGQLFPPNNIGSNPNISCPNGELLSWKGDHVDCTNPTPGVTVSCPEGQVLTGITHGSPLCVTASSGSWQAFDITDVTTRFNQLCEYRVWLSAASQNTYAPFFLSTVGPTVLYMEGVGPEGDLIAVAHSSVVSGVLHTDKTKWVWTSGGGFASLPEHSVVAIDQKCQ